MTVDYLSLVRDTHATSADALARMDAAVERELCKAAHPSSQPVRRQLRVVREGDVR